MLFYPRLMERKKLARRRILMLMWDMKIKLQFKLRYKKRFGPDFSHRMRNKCRYSFTQMAILKETFYDRETMSIVKNFLCKVTMIGAFNEKIISTCRATCVLQGHIRRYMLRKAILMVVEKLRAARAMEVKSKKKKSKRKKIA